MAVDASALQTSKERRRQTQATPYDGQRAGIDPGRNHRHRPRGVSDEKIDYTRDRLRTVLAKIGEPVLLARAKLTLASDPARARPAIAQALLDVNGDLVRAHVAAETPHVAADLRRRLRDKLEHRSQRRRALRKRRGVPEPGEWRHGDLPANRSHYYDRPLAERQLVRKRATPSTS